MKHLVPAHEDQIPAPQTGAAPPLREDDDRQAPAPRTLPGPHTREAAENIAAYSTTHRQSNKELYDQYGPVTNN